MKTSHISILTAIIALICSACSADEPRPADNTAAPTLTIKTRAPQAGASEKELINTWWIALVDASGTVTHIFDRPADKTNATDYEEFKMTIPRGTYTVYAFANIARGTHGLDFTVGATAPDLSKSTWSEVGAIGDAIPMTGVLRNVAFKGVASDNITIEVVRLWGKLSFEFTTDASRPVTVKKITMTPALTKAVSLMPDYTTLGKAPNLPEGTVCTALEHASALSIAKGDAAATESFYVLESTAKSHATGRYPLAFDLEYADGTTRTVSALAYQLGHINRNDHVIIPVLLTNWLIDLDVQFYPPIGGYPAVVLESKGEEYFASFGSSGRFVIRPTVTSASGSIVADKDIDIAISTSDPSGILRTAPYRDEKTLEIIGEIDTDHLGTAVIDLEISIKADALQHRILRKFYIIRKNS